MHAMVPMSPAPALTDFSSRLDKSLTVSLLTFNLPTLIRPFFFPARCFLLLVLVVILVSRFLVKWLNWAKRQPGFLSLYASRLHGGFI
jgi:hypothetical protein